MQALVHAKEQEQFEADRALTTKVLAHLRLSEPQRITALWPVWARWCEDRKITARPALPANIAVFVLNSRPDTAVSVVAAISAMHWPHADPTSHPLVIAALNQARPIEPPRSWDAQHKALWATLPRPIADYIRDRENDRDRALRQHMEKLRKESKSNGTHSTEAAKSAA